MSKQSQKINSWAFPYTLFFSLPLFTRPLFMKHFSFSIICFDKNQSPLRNKRNILEYRSTQSLDLCEMNQESLWALSQAINRLTHMYNNVWTYVKWTRSPSGLWAGPSLDCNGRPASSSRPSAWRSDCCISPSLSSSCSGAENQEAIYNR